MDIYTDWWPCKLMDKNTFQNLMSLNSLNENFNAVGLMEKFTLKHNGRSI